MNLLTTLLLGALACSPKSPPNGLDPSTPAPGATADTAPDESTVDSGGGPPADVTVAPSAQVLGDPGLNLHVVVRVYPPFGDHLPALFISNSVYNPYEPLPGFPGTVVVPLPIPPGEHEIVNLWDGVSSFDHGVVKSFNPAGDVNDDGFLDLWLSNRLFHGPFLGRSLAVFEDAVAWVDEDGEATAANFDADGDGHEDVLFASNSLLGIIHYGPFEGAIPGYRADSGFDPARMSRLGDGLACSEIAPDSRILKDQLGPGHHAIAIGAAMYCNPETYIYDLMQPRGVKVSPAQALAWNEFGAAEHTDPGDLDGDGHPDVLASTGTGHELYAGPVSGDLGELPAPVSVEEEIGWGSSLVQSLGDLDGDRIHDFLVIEQPDMGDTSTWRWGVLFSPYDEDPPKKRILYLGTWLEMPGAWDRPLVDRRRPRRRRRLGPHQRLGRRGRRRSVEDLVRDGSARRLRRPPRRPLNPCRRRPTRPAKTSGALLGEVGIVATGQSSCLHQPFHLTLHNAPPPAAAVVGSVTRLCS